MRMMAIAASIVGLVTASLAGGAEEFVITAEGVEPAVIFVGEGAPGPVQYAVRDFQEDAMEATGQELDVVREVRGTAQRAIAPMVIGESELLERLRRDGMVDATDIKGKRGCFKIVICDGESVGAGDILAIVGSDARGAMYGLYEVSERAFGTDPMKIWTDYIPERQGRTVFSGGPIVKGPPTFRYRGFFINDEDFLMGWRGEKADNVVEPEVQADILETICRTRGNLIAPPMYAQYMTPETLQLAHDRGVVYTASHLELLLANPQNYWRSYCREHFGRVLDYSFSKHQEEMEQFWRDSIERHKRYANIWPVGLRGITDRPFWSDDPEAPKSAEARAELTSKAIKRELEVLRGELGPGAEPITSLTMYNEVLNLYRTGELDVPPEVMLIWPDDNHGRMRGLPNEQERKRPGGNGVYHHITFCDNQWVQWIPLEMIRDEFARVIESGATDYALFNVGDIREIPLSIAGAMDVVWDADPWLADDEYPRRFLLNWTEKHFGEAAAEPAADVYQRFYELERECRSQPTFERVQRSLDAALEMTRRLGLPMFPISPEVVMDQSPQRDLLERLEELRPQWDALYEQALETYVKIPNHRQWFFFDNMILQIQTSRQVNAYGTNILSALQCATIEDYGAAREYVKRASAAMERIATAREKASHDKWQTWFRKEWGHTWGLKPDQRIAELKELAGLMRRGEDASAEAMSQIVMFEPRAMAVTGAEGTAKECTATLGKWRPEELQSAELYVLAYDTDADREARFFVNGHEYRIAETGDSRSRLFRFEIPPEQLRAGENSIRFVFADDLDGNTSGYGVSGMTLVLWPGDVEPALDVEAEGADHIESPMKREKREGASGGKCLVIPDGVGGEGGDGGPGFADYAFRVDEPGLYYTWVRAWWADGAANSLHISIDGEPKRILGNTNEFGEWIWARSGVRYLTAGKHTLRLSNREDGARLDRVVIAASAEAPG